MKSRKDNFESLRALGRNGDHFASRTFEPSSFLFDFHTPGIKCVKMEWRRAFGELFFWELFGKIFSESFWRFFGSLKTILGHSELSGCEELLKIPSFWTFKKLVKHCLALQHFKSFIELERMSKASFSSWTLKKLSKLNWLCQNI